MQIFKKQTKKIIWQSNFDNIFIYFIYWNIFINTNNRNTRKKCRRHWRRSGAFIVNFEHISYVFLMFLLMTLNKGMLAGKFQPIIVRHFISSFLLK